MKRILLSSLLLCVLSPAIPAFAGASATSTIHWESFSVQLIDLSGGLDTPEFVWSFAYGEVFSVASNPYVASYGGWNQAVDLSTPLQSAANITGAQVTVSRDANTLHAYAATEPAAVGELLGTSNFANGWANTTGYFSLSGKGVAIITVGWDVSVTGSIGDWSDYGYADAGIAGSYSDGLYNYGFANSSGDLYSTNNGDSQISGSFAFAVVGSGDAITTGQLYAQARAFAYSPLSPVPEPESYMLMVVGLSMLVWLTRRRES
ncbi:MAG TPA: PEP-CTERM sorting domain-containing protein [Thiobacillaceae bacterium]|nr:PEP-CTERM sorting domain-containing protein [Thiobacillaceae bacterium]HNA82846.1 PEP-CTERM sorting domain-containing protein [Thiobacillaceae bacterium]HNI07605.1 PEP-CTERM sorting domain-containing protein [Thiobacillaceae bacterium]